MVFCARHGWKVERRASSGMGGMGVTAMDNRNTSEKSHDADALPPPLFSSLPCLDDSNSVSSSLSSSPPTRVIGWVSILKYLALTYLDLAENSFYPPVPRSFNSNSSAFIPTQEPARGVSASTSVPSLSPSSTQIDSVLESFSSFSSDLDALTHHFLSAATRADQASLMPQLQQTFDAQGNARPPYAGLRLGAGRGVDTGVTSMSDFSLERSIRAVRAHISHLQDRLASLNPTATAEYAVEAMRKLDSEPDSAHTAQRHHSANIASQPDDKLDLASNEANHPTELSAFVFLAGSNRPSLCDFVAFFLLHHLPLLRLYLPSLTPSTHAHLFLFCTHLTREYTPHLFDLSWVSGAGLWSQSGGGSRHLLLERHPILQLQPTPTAELMAEKKKGKKDDEMEEEAKLSSSEVGSFSEESSNKPLPAITEDSNASLLSPASTPSTSSPSLSPSSSFVPRLTRASKVAERSARGMASSLAVEDTDDLMSYVERLSVRPRAATPAWETIQELSPLSSSSTSPNAGPTASPTAPDSLSLAPEPLPPLVHARTLADRLLFLSDHACVDWGTVQERAHVTLLAPVLASPLAAPLSSPSSRTTLSKDHMHYHAMTVT